MMFEEKLDYVRSVLLVENCLSIQLPTVLQLHYNCITVALQLYYSCITVANCITVGTFVTFALLVNIFTLGNNV